MRGILLGGWLLVPVLMGAYHYGPGQRRMELDQTQDALSAARKSVQAKHYDVAVKQFSEALAAIPSDQVAEARRIRLERAKAQLLEPDLTSAYNELTALLRDPNHGQSRVLLLRALQRSKEPRARRALMELGADPVLAKEVEHLVKRKR